MGKAHINPLTGNPFGYNQAMDNRAVELGLATKERRGGMDYYVAEDPYAKLMQDLRALRPTLPTDDPYTNGLSFAPDMRGMEAFRQEALRTGPSGWATLQQQLSDQRRMEGLDRAVQQASTFGAQQRADLAQRGGLGSGAAERIGRAGAEQRLMLGQDAYRQSDQDRLNIGIEDENRRMAALSSLPQMEQNLAQQKLQARQWQTQQQDDWRRWLYGQQSAVAAAEAAALNEAYKRRYG